MRYCTRCKRIYFNNENGLCPLCGRQMTDDPNILSPVYVLTANGFELERVRSVLDSEGIAYTVNEARHDAGIQILNSAPPENCDVYVTLSEYERAVETLKGSGAISDDIPEPDEKAKEQISEAKKKDQEEHLDPKKARNIRIFSAIAFLLILVGVVYLTDFIIALVRKLFGI